MPKTGIASRLPAASLTLGAQAGEDPAGVLGRLAALGASLQAAQASLESRIDARFEAVARLDAALAGMGRGVAALGEKLDRIAEAVGVRPSENSGDDDEDRKRIKERLKEALEIHKRQQGLEQAGFVEYFFGICRADGRVGKAGSRFGRVAAAS